MADIDDRWYRKGPGGKAVRTDRYGKGARWLVRWRDPAGAQRKKSFVRKSDAEDYASEIRQGMRTGSYVAPDAGRMVIDDWARRWLDAQGHLRESTFDRTRGVVENYVVPRWGGTPLSSVTHADVHTWIAELGRSGASARSVVKVHGIFRLIMAWAVKDGRIARNPADGVPLPRAALSDHRYLDHSEVAMLAKECGTSGAVVRVLAYTGLRWARWRRCGSVASISPPDVCRCWSPSRRSRGASSGARQRHTPGGQCRSRASSGTSCDRSWRVGRTTSWCSPPLAAASSASATSAGTSSTPPSPRSGRPASTRTS